MPTYRYVCEKCGLEFDYFQSMKDDPLTACPREACQQKRWGRGKVKRQLGTGAGIIFKGSGFYVTDYRSESYRKAAKKEATSSTPKTDGAKSPTASPPKPAKASPKSDS